MTGDDRVEEATPGRTNRRRFLAVLGALGITAAAGCGGDGNDTDTGDAETPTDIGTDDDGAPATPTATEPATEMATETRTSTERSTPTESGATLGENPAGLLSFGQETLEPADGSITLTGEMVNPYLHGIQNGSVELDVPDGWEVTDESGTKFDALGSQASQTAEWNVSVPEDASGDYDLTATVAYGTSADEAEVTVEHTVSIFNEQEAQFSWSAADYDVEETPEDAWEPMSNVDSWAIREDDAGKYVELDGPDTTRSFLRYTEAGPARQVDVRATMQAVDLETGDYFVYVRGQNEGDVENVIAARIDDYHLETSHRISRYLNGEWSEFASDGRAIEGDTRYVVRATYDLDGLRAKWWPMGEPEPDEWYLEAQPDLSDPGRVGVGHYEGDACKLYDYAVGTGGADAPTE